MTDHEKLLNSAFAKQGKPDNKQQVVLDKETGDGAFGEGPIALALIRKIQSPEAPKND